MCVSICFPYFPGLKTSRNDEIPQASHAALGLEAGLVATTAPRQPSAVGAGVAGAGAGGAGEGEAEGLALSSDGFHGGVKGCLMTNDGYGRIYNVFW